MSERDIFIAAREMTDPAARSAYLDGACGGDPGLRSRVEALLRAHDQPDSLLDHPAVAPHDPGSAATRTIGHEGGAATDDEAALGFLAPPTRPDALGRLGHYEVLQVLGRGGFGIVFRAFDEILQRVVALKVMAPQLAATSPARKRFLREARSSAQVRHENVVQVYEVAEQPLPYLAMEFIPGETLQQRLDRVGPLDVPEALRIGRQIAEGLTAAHAMDLIHRDIKPGNVLLEGGQHKVKITDFGLARTADDASISQSGLIAGTPMYMAPEQAEGHTLDQRADLFSLGSVLYQMVSGRPPFRANTTVAVLKRVAEDQPRAIREIIPETPQWLCDIIAKLHAKDPDARYQSAREVADVLADCEAQLKANARLKDYSRIPAGKPAPARSARRKWRWAAGTAIALLVCGALWISPAASRYAGNRGEVEFAPDPGLTAMIVFQNDKPVTDWIDVRTRPAIQLPPGSYRLEGKFRPGLAADRWELRNVGLFSTLTSAQNSRSCELNLERGQRLNIRVVARDDPAIVPGPPNQSLSVPLLKYGDTEYTNTLGMKFKLIPAGKFTMGSPKEEIDRCLKQPGPYKENLPTEGPEHPVEITRPFYLGATEVTVGQFRQFVDEEAYQVGDGRWRNPAFDQTDQHPMVFVSWNNAVDFCKWLSAKEGKEYRLPTEAEWEYSCRAGKAGSRYGFGDDDAQLENYAWFDQNSGGGTHPVGKKKPNAWGLYDMHGNAWEWCQDNYDPNYYKNSPVKDPPGGAGGARAGRGGGWVHGPVLCRSAFRGYLVPDDHVGAGFRVLLVPPPAGVGTESGAKDKPPPRAIAPFTDADVQRIAALPPEQQVEELRKELKRRNPGFDGTLTPIIENGVVTGLQFLTDQVDNIAPVRALGRLTSLDCCGTYPNKGKLSDLSPLQGMPLKRLHCRDTQAADLTALRGMPLTSFSCSNTRVSDLTLLKDMALVELHCANTGVRDLSPLKGMKLRELQAQGIPASDLTPLQGMPLTHLDLYLAAAVADLQPLQGMPLEYLNLARLPVTDLSPLKGMTSLRRLVLHEAEKLSDLAPLKGLPLSELDLRNCRAVRDLEPLRGMPLTRLTMFGAAATDLRPLQGMALEEIRLTPRTITQGLKVLRDLESLKTIGVDDNSFWPAAEFWERHDKGEFKE